MEDFLVRGHHFHDCSKILELKLPTAREYKILSFDNSNEIIQPSLLIKHAVRMRQQTFLKRGLSQPVIYRGYEEVKLHSSLQQILSKHPFPLRQGPFIPQLACTIYSNLTENQIQLSINKLMKKKTSVVVAHRLSTIEDADLIYVMENGKITDSGNHDYLLQNSSMYKNLQIKERLENEN